MPKSSPTSDPAKAIGAILINCLHHHSAGRPQNPGTGFLTLQQLLLSVPPEQTPFAHAALAKAPAKSSIIVAVPNQPLSPVALTEEFSDLASAPQTLLFLAQLIDSGCSPNTPVVPVADLVKSLDRRLQKHALAHWSTPNVQLPEGLAAVTSTKGKKISVAIHDLRYPRQETLFANQLISQLASISTHADSPFTTLAQLTSACGIPADAPALAAALNLPEFQSHIRILRGRGADAWIAPANNLPALLSSDALLQCLLREACSESAPEIRLSALAKLLAKDLHADFISAWRTRATPNTTSPVCEWSPAGTAAKPDLLLRDIRFPKPEKRIARQLIQSLLQIRESDAPNYPPSWLTLHQQAAPAIPRDLLHKASLCTDFQTHAAIASPGAPDSPVFLLNDLPQAARSPAMLQFLVRRATTEQSAGIPADKLASTTGLLTPLKPLITAAVQDYISGALLPQGIALAQINRKWLFLDLSKIRGATNLLHEQPAPNNSAAPPTPSPSESARSLGQSTLKSDPPTVAENQQTHSHEFPAAFAAAFERLSRTSHLPGYVSLADLRPALTQFDRHTFDTQLLQLRRTGQFSLSLLEGRLALSSDEQAAVLTIDNRPYLLVHRRP